MQQIKLEIKGLIPVFPPHMMIIHKLCVLNPSVEAKAPNFFKP